MPFEKASHKSEYSDYPVLTAEEIRQKIEAIDWDSAKAEHNLNKAWEIIVASGLDPKEIFDNPFDTES